MKVFVGRWSELEMSGGTISENPPYRMVAVETADDAIVALGCTGAWFSSWFVEEDHEERRSIALASPGTVLESCVEVDYDKWPLESKCHWVALDKLPEFRRQLEGKLAAAINKNPPSNVRLNPFQHLSADGSKVLSERLAAMMAG